jgi:hypothetical protein
MAIKKREIIFWLLIATAIIATFRWSDANAGGVTIGTVSSHTGGEGGYDESNPGICIDDGFRLFGIACVYQDSHSDTAIALAVGGRKPISELVESLQINNLYLGILGGITDSDNSEHTPIPRLLVAGLVTYGTERFSTNIMLSPAVDDRPAVRYLTFRIGY